MCNSLFVFKWLFCKDILNVTDTMNFQYIQIPFVMLEGDVFLLLHLYIYHYDVNDVEGYLK